MSSTVVLVNPTSRSGATGRRLPALERLLRKYVGEYRLVRTERAGDGQRLAREAVAAGITRLVIAGGDGTASEALTGLLDGQRTSAVEVGLLPLGSGSDFARLLKVGTNLEAAVARLVQGRRGKIDAGRIRYRAADGSERTRCFLNVASFGLSGESALWLDAQGKMGKRGPLSYVRSAFVGLSRYRMPEVTIRLDGRTVHTGSLLFAAVGNGQYFGGGMRVTPGASIDDGQFDVVLARGMPIAAALAFFPQLLLARHLRHPLVSAHRGFLIEAESTAEVWLEADGEPIGTLPATIELLPGAVMFCGLG